MAEQIYYSLFTDAGLKLITQSIQSGQKLGITHMAFGDGNGSLPVPNKAFTKLVKEVYRMPLNSLSPDPQNANWLRAEAVIASAIGGFNIRELGLYAGDVLVAYSNYPPTYKPSPSDGTARIMTFRMVLQIDNTANFELVIDPDVVLATIGYVEQIAVDSKIKTEDGRNQKQINDVTVQTVESVADLIAIKNPRNGQTVQVKSYHAGLNKGGGLFVYDSTKASTNDGGMCINGWLRQDVRVSVECFGANGDGIRGNTATDDTQAIQAALDSLNSDGCNLYFDSAQYRITNTLTISNRNRITLYAQQSIVSFDGGVDKIVFKIKNCQSLNIIGIGSANFSTACTFINAESSHHLHVDKAYFNGCKLGFDLSDCYFTHLNDLHMQSIGQFFVFRGAVNAFNLTNCSAYGTGSASIITDSIGGHIRGCSFEDLTGRINITTSFGLDISGNYFEGYNNKTVDNYIAIGAGNYKNTAGINISGNLFYQGCQNAIKLNNVGGINISGNYIGTDHAIDIFCFDDSTQTDINYIANHFVGTGAEVTWSGKEENASISTEYAAPVIFKLQQLSARRLKAGETQIYNQEGRLCVQNKKREGAILTAQDITRILKFKKLFNSYTNRISSYDWAMGNLNEIKDTQNNNFKYIAKTEGLVTLYTSIDAFVGNIYAFIIKIVNNQASFLTVASSDGQDLANYPTNYLRIETGANDYIVLLAKATQQKLAFGVTGTILKDASFNIDKTNAKIINISEYYPGDELTVEQVQAAVDLTSIL